MPAVFSPVRLHRLSCLVPVALALAACGGGSDSADPATPSTPLALTGTAATGAAIANKLVEAKCKGAAASANSQNDGTYSIALPGGQLPCVLRVTAADGTVLHSVATGSGSAAKANITPVSELVLANLSATAPASFFGSFDATAAAALTQVKADAAVTAVVGTLKTAGVDLTAAGHVLTGSLVAASGSTAGNALDQGLDALKSKLATASPDTDFKTALAALADALAKASPDAPATALRNDPSLPADMLLQPAAANCSTLRSGKYRLVYNQNRAGNGSYDTQVLTIDAATLTLRNAAGEVNQLTANGTCRYKTPGGGDLVVSLAGIIVGQISDNGAFHLGLAFPEQTHPLSALAGAWNSLQLDRTEDGGPIVLTNSTGTVDAAGKLTARTFCEIGADGCVGDSSTSTATGLPGIVGTVNSDGGFNWANAADGWTDRVFLYKSGGGELLRVQLSSAGGHLGLATRQVAGTLPAVGRVTEFMSITQNNNYTASGFSDSKHTVRTVDATANSFLRDAVVFQNGVATSVTQPETFRLGNPRDGFSLRVGETVTASDGSSRTVTPFIAMALRGTGITVVGFPGTNSLVLSVAK
jgi:hypothetical protein